MRPTNIPRLIALAALSTLLTGCLFSRSYVNDPIDAEAVAQLEPGQSTAADVVGLLGAPSQVVELGDRSAYRYDHRKVQGTGLFLFLFNLRADDVRSDVVWVFFDASDRLTHVGSTLSAERARYRLPFQDRE